MKIEVSAPELLSAAAISLLDFAPEERIFLFYGDMGAGKTTFIKEICRILKVGDSTSSPTFSIVNEYSSPRGPVYHFDFYRLKTETEALDIGYEDYIRFGDYCFIEWPERISSLLPDKYCKVEIEVTGPQSRIIRAEISSV